MDIRKEMQEYVAFLHRRNFHYKTDSVLQLIDDPDLLADYSVRNGVRLGIIYQSRFHTMVVDLVRKQDGTLLPYERLVKTAEGNSVVMVPFCGGKIILLKQFRHALGDFQYCFPRGFGEPGLSPEENARKEIREELNCDAQDFRLLGHTVADSGVCGEKVHIFRCTVTNPSVDILQENIAAYTAVTESELRDMIRSGQIDDGFTLAAAAMFL